MARTAQLRWSATWRQESQHGRVEFRSFRVMATNSDAPLPPGNYAEREKVAPMPELSGARSEIALADLTRNNLGQLKKLNEVLFPVKYSDKVYDSLLQPELRPLCKLGACIC